MGGLYLVEDERVGRLYLVGDIMVGGWAIFSLGDKSGLYLVADIYGWVGHI